MSKLIRAIPALFYFAAVIALSGEIAAQDITATLEISDKLPRVVKVSGSFSEDYSKKRARNLSFVLNYAGIQGLGARISDVSLYKSDGSAVPNKKMVDGEYLPASPFERFVYTVDADPGNRLSSTAHVSWLSDDAGVLMLGDLLPLAEAGSDPSARITLLLPAGWKSHSIDAKAGVDTFTVDNYEKAVFFIGKDWRRTKVADLPIDLVTRGESHVPDNEAAGFASEIYLYYRKLFGSDPAPRALIAITPFPMPAPTGRWHAETRGATLLVVSEDMPFATRSRQLLHEQLRHEIFHLWIPNGVKLSGNYDWFYEGFALYESLKTGLALNRIRFEDFLDTLSRFRNFERSSPRPSSLIDLAKARWGGTNSQIYARGMLAAFLIDIALLEKSKGRTSTRDIVRDLHMRGVRTEKGQDANALILEVLRSKSELGQVVDRYIIGTEPIDWSAALLAAGLEDVGKGDHSVLKTAAKPNSRQKAILDRLGYNNWRNLPRKQ